jgi:hypothetical protein
MAQVSGKSPAPMQHRPLKTVPPDWVHALSSPGVAVASGGGVAVGAAVGSTTGTQALPSKQLPAPHSQTRTSWLLAGAQPQAPTAQVSGKSPVVRQQLAVST